jgi:hypothetical protein
MNDRRILHLWDTHVGDPTQERPLTDADKLAFARAVLASMEDEIARVIYDQWEDWPGWVPWVDGGNSIKQDLARTLARVALMPMTESA